MVLLEPDLTKHFDSIKTFDPGTIVLFPTVPIQQTSIFTNLLCSGHSFGLFFRKTEIAETLFISLCPFRFPMLSEPKRSHVSQHMEQVAQRFSHDLKTTEGTESCQDMG